MSPEVAEAVGQQSTASKYVTTHQRQRNSLSRENEGRSTFSFDGGHVGKCQNALVMAQNFPLFITRLGLWWVPNCSTSLLRRSGVSHSSAADGILTLGAVMSASADRYFGGSVLIKGTAQSQNSAGASLARMICSMYLVPVLIRQGLQVAPANGRVPYQPQDFPCSDLAASPWP
jgi:hypothetical protein